MKKFVVRVYEVTIKDTDQYNNLMDQMISDDPEIESGNNGDPSREWLDEQLALRMTYQYDMGNYVTADAAVNGVLEGDAYVVSLDQVNRIQNILLER